ncbi:MAG: pyrroline-5-carboxylate reductase [Spirochaetaceae bacterium]|jgi:pyrroline-5-carboxylate reductase|nr:pyrroline-5-carboxylate reductase [Spirochaetaceae bacterium]
MKTLIACIGAGNMGTALMKGAAAAAGGENIGFSDADKAKARASARLMGAMVFGTNTEAVKTGKYVFLAVKPQVLPSVLAEIAPIVRERIVSGDAPILVSLAAGWSIGKIQAIISGSGMDVPAARAPVASVPVARIMPNTPALISQGMIAFSASHKFPSTRLDELEKILGGAGLVDKVDEKLMDAVTGLSGSAPAFVCQFIEALADGGVLAGLSRDKALRYAAQTVMGTAAMVLQTGRHPGELKDMVTSPGGTTIQGVAALERGAFRGAVISAVEAAWKRSGELG